MRYTLILLALVLFFSCNTTKSSIETSTETIIEQTDNRDAELDLYWAAISKTVQEGDIKGYEALYHEDAVVVFASGKNKSSVSLKDALKGWEQGFTDTKDGKIEANVKFRFSQRIGSSNTAHETGIFDYFVFEEAAKSATHYLTHFEAIFVKKDGKWLMLSENQIAPATQGEWDALIE